MLNMSLRDIIVNHKIKERTSETDDIKIIITLKWNWAGHVPKIRDGRRTKRILEEIPRHDEYYNRGRAPN